ncbi:MAG: hypothetical protein J6P84_05820, partial [Alphaproteobacteria bacterium]|nr:hypothetical protein [Alphaproteobacteria bacterium]
SGFAGFPEVGIAGLRPVPQGLLKNSLLKRHPKGAFSGNSTPKAFIKNGGAFGTIKKCNYALRTAAFSDIIITTS